MIGAKRRCAVIPTTIVIAAGAMVLAPAPAHATATATMSSCDSWVVIGLFRPVLSGASFWYRGRWVMLLNESLRDVYSRAQIGGLWRPGDLVWVDRSHRRFDTHHGIIDNQGAEAQGWRQCGPFRSRASWHVFNNVYAARACARIDGRSVCGRWYVD